MAVRDLIEVFMGKLRQTLPTLVGTLIFLLAQSVVDARGTPRPPPSEADEKPIVLETFHAGNLDLDLTMQPCRLHECPIHVRLLDAGHVVDHVALPIPASYRRIKAEAVDQDWGADQGLTAWRSGFESDYVATVGRVITIAPQTTGLLVTQRHGFEPVKREHLLVLVRRGKLRVIWKAQESPGATWSATRVLSGSDARSQDIAYFQGFVDPTGAAADHFEAVRLKWAGASASFNSTPLPDASMPLYLLSLGTYVSAAQAREERSMRSFCLAPYWVLDASAFPMKPHANAVIGKIYMRRSLAEAAAQQVKSCLPSIRPTVVQWAAGR
jgi:hypothetical protein